MKKFGKILLISAFVLSAAGTTMVASADNVNNQQENAATVSSSNESMKSIENMSDASSSTNNGSAIQKKELSKSYIVFGSGLSAAEQKQVADVLVGNSNPENFTDLIANADDYNQYINNGQPSDTTNASMISSVAIEPSDPGSGIKVDIKNFNGENNITQVTQQQYAMAAQMAGVTDINIVVTANRSVSGTSALTGVYEALAQDGIKLNNENTSAANGVLSATQQATQGMKPADQSKVVQATGQTAQQIAKDNQSGNPDSQQQIADLLKKNLDKQGVNISGNNINILANSLNTFKKTPVAQTKNFAKGMDNTLDNIKDSVDGNMIKAQDWAEAHQGWFTRIINNIKAWWNQHVVHKNEVNIQNNSSNNGNAAQASSNDLNN